ncbi:hypothetical protein TNCT_403551 [Trichonephila clavata]|uniref:Uncharacterized protein n=1 Tax=Trichonephila clavata TaxID=2740835 RepID=A0A8X6HC60_TRICU|nr:hypothetical protein TNCT_403551 [Trichonephila clavata]
MLKPVNGPPKTFQDAMDPLRNKETAQDAHLKSPIQSRPTSGSECRFDITGNLLSILRGPIQLTKLCFNLSLTTEDLSG